LVLFAFVFDAGSPPTPCGRRLRVRPPALVEGRARAERRGELPPAGDPAEAARATDLSFDMVAGAVVHRTLVSAEPADEEWVRSFTRILPLGLSSA
jgi:hypothetical protein